MAYNPQLLQEIAQRAKKVLFIDHHKTHQKEIEDLNLPKPHEIVYRIDRCGATLVWDYFYGSKPVPKFVQLVEDNDLGYWKMKDTLPFVTAMEVLFSMKPYIDVLRQWDKLLKPKQLENIIKKGKTFEEYKQNLIKKVAKGHYVVSFPSQWARERFGLDDIVYKVGVINGGTPSTSLVGKYVVDNYPVDFCLLYRIDLEHKRFIVSLRSKEVDVGEIAKRLGGGGHALASGFIFSMSDHNEKFLWDMFDYY